MRRGPSTWQIHPSTLHLQHWSWRCRGLTRLRGVEKVDALVAYVSDLGVCRVDLECGLGVWTEQVGGRQLGLPTIEPLIVFGRHQDCRHAIVDGAHRGAGFHGDD